MNSSLSLIDLASFLPLLLLFVAILSLVLIESFPCTLTRSVTLFLPLVLLCAALVAAFYAPISTNPLLTAWVVFDPLARFFSLFFILIGIGACLLAISFFQHGAVLALKINCGEYFILLLSAIAGLLLIGMAADFLTLFIGLELLSIALYVLCGYMKSSIYAQESSIKYFLMGAFATSFLLYGIALLYGATGSTNFSALLAGYQRIESFSDKALFTCGIAFVSVALAFKAAVVPFHGWAPDVYAGAPSPVVALMAIGTKVAAFAALVRIFLVALPQFDPFWNHAIAALAAATLIYANFVALRQREMRRFFAYSGIAHAGFLLVPLAVGTTAVIPAALFYLSVYALATFAAFAVVMTLDRPGGSIMLSHLSGLFYRAPLQAAILTLSLLTLAGIPPTVGFFAKFYLFKIAFGADYIALVIVGALMTILAAFYYVRIIATMASLEYKEETQLFLSPTAVLVGIISSLAILGLSLYPDTFLSGLDAIAA